MPPAMRFLLMSAASAAVAASTVPIAPQADLSLFNFAAGSPEAKAFSNPRAKATILTLNDLHLSISTASWPSSSPPDNSSSQISSGAIVSLSGAKGNQTIGDGPVRSYCARQILISADAPLNQTNIDFVGCGDLIPAECLDSLGRQGACPDSPAPSPPKPQCRFYTAGNSISTSGLRLVGSDAFLRYTVPNITASDAAAAERAIDTLTFPLVVTSVGEDVNGNRQNLTGVVCARAVARTSAPGLPPRTSTSSGGAAVPTGLGGQYRMVPMGAAALVAAVVGL